MKQLKIALITNNYMPYQGGVVNSISVLTEQLQQNHTVKILTLDFGRQQDPDCVLRLQCPVKFKFKQNYMAYPFFAKKQIQKHLLQARPDIVHVHHPFLLGKAGLKAAQSLSIPVIFTYHTMYEHYAHYVPLPQKLVQQFIKKRISWFCSQVDGIIAPSTYIKNYLHSLNIKKSIEVIPSALQPMFFEKKDNAVLPYENKKINLLLVSRFRKEKNISFILEVVKKLPRNSFTLTLVGYGSELCYLKEYAFNKLGLTEQEVIFVEQPSKKELLLLYKKADLFLFPSQTDTQGLVLAEALSQKTPIIALPGAGQEDIIENGKNGYIVLNQQEMVSKILTISRNKHLLGMLQENAVKTAQKYTPKAMSGQVTGFYRQILQKKGKKYFNKKSFV